MRARPYQSLIAATGVLLTSGCASLPVSSKLARQAEGPENQPSVLVNLRPDYLYFNNMWNGYLTRRGDPAKLDQKIEECRTSPGKCTPLFQAWVKMIDTINLLPPDTKIVRAQLLVGFVGKLLDFDKKKSDALGALLHSSTWLQTPEETLNKKGGLATCGDYSAMIYETALRTKFSPRDVSLIGGMHPSGAFHITAALKIDGTNYALDGVDYSGNNPAQPDLIKYSDYVKGYTFEHSPWVKSPQFTPLFTMNDSKFSVLGGFLKVIGTPILPTATPVIVRSIKDKNFNEPLSGDATGKLQTATGNIQIIVDLIEKGKTPAAASKAQPKQAVKIRR